MEKFRNFDDLFEDHADGQEDSGDLLFAEPATEPAPDEEAQESPEEQWKILIVDDEEDIHAVTRIALKGFTFRGRPIEFFDAYSAGEAEVILKEHPDIALILLDVVMETTNAGLDLVKVIREKLGNKVTQIIIRTGQPGQAPEREVIVSYEINDYKTKTELTSFKLFTVALASLRAYDSIRQIGRINKEFKTEIEKHIRREKVLTTAKEKAEKSEKLKTEFLNQLSEKIHEPLNLILSSSDQIKKEVKDQVNDNIRLMLDEMNYSGREIIRAVQMIMDLSEIQAGRYGLNRAPVSLEDAIGGIVASQEILLKRNGIELVVKDSSGIRTIVTDAYALHQILSNLLDNAAKNAGNNRISLAVDKHDNGSIEFSVSDIGQGIHKTFQKEMFEPFRRENGAKNHGLGLGLTLAREFSRMLGGQIQVMSEQGKGTVITLKLPVEPADNLQPGQEIEGSK